MRYIEMNSESLPNSWKISVPSRWGHSLHSICARTCSFPPKLAHYFISCYSKVGDKILDLYSGKGTAPLEACLLGRLGIGNDFCPDAFVLTYAKTHPPTKSAFFEYLNKVKSRLQKTSISDVPDDVKLYFSQKTLQQLLSIREVIHSDLDKLDKRYRDFDNAMFLQALMLGILHGRTKYCLSLPVPHSFAMSPAYVRKKVAENPEKFATPERDVIECLRVKANRVYKDPFPLLFQRGKAFMIDASKFSFKQTVDMVLTSPPYFDAHTYAWDNWLRLWFLGYEFRKVASMLFHTGSEAKYLKHIEDVLKTVYGLLKNDTRCFVVVGDVKGHKPTAYLIADVVERCKDIGFKVYRIITDNIDPRYRYPYGDNTHVGIVKDRILELHKGKPEDSRTSVVWSYY